MALSDSLRAQIYLSALGAIQRGGEYSDDAAVARMVRAKFGTEPPTSYLSYLNIVRQARKASEAAGKMEADPTKPLGQSQTPATPSTAQSGSRYEYRIVIVADPGNGGEVFRTAVTVTSETPLSQQDLVAIGVEMFNRQNLERDYRNRIGRLGANPAIDVIVTAAGRTR